MLRVLLPVSRKEAFNTPTPLTSKGLVIIYGEGVGLQNVSGEGGGGLHVKFYPYKKGGGGRVWHKKFWGSFYVVA